MGRGDLGWGWRGGHGEVDREVLGWEWCLVPYCRKGEGRGTRRWHLGPQEKGCRDTAASDTEYVGHGLMALLGAFLGQKSSV